MRGEQLFGLHKRIYGVQWCRDMMVVGSGLVIDAG